MPKTIPKRSPTKILAVYIEMTADSIRRILMWTFNPIALDFESTTVWNSGDLIADKLSVKVTIEKLIHHIRSVNETGSIDTLPSLLIWDRFQLTVLENHIPSLANLFRRDGIVILQEKCYDIFKYDLRINGFGLQEIAESMGFTDKQDYAKFARVALQMEQSFKELAKKLKHNAVNPQSLDCEI